MKLLAAFLSIVEDWQGVFPQKRTYQRAVRQALGSLTCLGPRRRCSPVSFVSAIYRQPRAGATAGQSHLKFS